MRNLIRGERGTLQRLAGEARFTTVKLRPGYVMADVDSLLTAVLTLGLHLSRAAGTALMPLPRPRLLRSRLGRPARLLAIAAVTASSVAAVRRVLNEKNSSSPPGVTSPGAGTGTPHSAAGTEPLGIDHLEGLRRPRAGSLPSGGRGLRRPG